MVRLKTHILVNGMNLWNWISELYSKTKHRVYDFYSYLFSYIRGENNIWCIFQNYKLPLPYSMTNNYSPILWKYHSLKKHLSYNDNHKPIDIISKVSWLSIKLVIKEKNHKHEIDLDPFFNDLKIYTHSNISPTLQFILLAWSISHKQWFLSSDTIEFHIIDNMGEDHILELNKDNTCLFIEKQKLSFKKSE
jgi:hypothetical protein